MGTTSSPTMFFWPCWSDPTSLKSWTACSPNIEWRDRPYHKVRAEWQSSRTGWFQWDVPKKMLAVRQGWFLQALCKFLYWTPKSGVYKYIIHHTFPKKDSPKIVSDYCPISLMNISLKIITKVLADRLQTIILRAIHQNQYCFIWSRTIQDCLAWSYEYIDQCHQSKREVIILKLDFERAFDTIEHSVILQVMTHMGFPQRWLMWVKAILSSGSSAVLLNGVPRKIFRCKRGVRQGGPLSPLLFVLTVELL
jgi:hypothetical protein